MASLAGLLLARAASGLAVLALMGSGAAAEPVQHRFSGAVEFVTDGTAGTLDLTGTFEAAQPVTIVTTIERSTPGTRWGSGEMYYLDAITQWSLSIGPYTRPPGPALSLSGIYVGNDITQEAARSLNPAGFSGSAIDHYNLAIPWPESPAVGSAVATHLVIDLVDLDASAWTGTELPRTLPDLAEFESATWTLQFVESGKIVGLVTGTLGAISTPAVPSSWGRIKAGYRE